MRVVWEGTLDGSDDSLVYRVLLEETASMSSSQKSLDGKHKKASLIPSFVVEKRGWDSLGGVKWDLEHLDHIGYRQALSRAFEFLTKEPEGFKKCEYCHGSGYDDFQAGFSPSSEGFLEGLDDEENAEVA